jgi:membrane-associated protease RseP (regulator of RpoE activity)
VAAAEEAMDVWSVRRPLDTEPTKGSAFLPHVSLELRGKLRMPSERAYEVVAERFRALGHIALFRRSPDGDLVLAVPGALPTKVGQTRVAAALFAATLLSVLLVGAMSAQRPGQDFNLLAGWPFAAGLLGILVAHEMGHYVVARALGVPASLPYFIPMPFSIFGTMGAVMVMKAPPKNRRALLALGAAGPLAGLVVAVPALLYGLSLSSVGPIQTGPDIIQEGNSLLYLGLKMLVFGRLLPSGGQDVFLHPVAMAGWAGLLVTALNLIPAGQLDGGHALYSLIGERASKVTWGIIAAMLGLSILWPGWLLWAGLVYFLGRSHAVPLDDITEPRRRERILAIAMLVIAALVFVPIPMNFW